MKQKTQLEAYCSLPGGEIILSGARVLGGTWGSRRISEMRCRCNWWDLVALISNSSSSFKHHSKRTVLIPRCQCSEWNASVVTVTANVIVTTTITIAPVVYWALSVRKACTKHLTHYNNILVNLGISSFYRRGNRQVKLLVQGHRNISCWKS